MYFPGSDLFDRYTSFDVGETVYTGSGVNLNKLANQIKDFLRNDGFTKTKISKDSYGHYFDVQGIKSGWWRTISSSRKALHVIIEGAPNRFTVNVGVGEWGKNIGVATLTALSTMGIGLLFQGAGVGSNILFERKLNKFIESTIVQLRGTVSDRDTSQHRAQKIIHKTRKPKNVRPTLPKESPHDSFVRLRKYIVNARTEQANYQPVMIRALLKNNGYCSKDIIANELYLYNTSKKKDPTFYKYVPVFGVLEKNGVVVKDVDGYLLIGAKNLTEDQKNTLVDLCDAKILQDSTSVLPEKKIVYAAVNSVNSEEETHYLLLRHKIQNRWADDLGKKYHYGTTVPHYKKLKAGTKTVWYDKKDGDYYIWGFGTVSNVRALPMSMGEKISHQTKKFHAYFDDFTQFEEDQPIKASNHIQEKIVECFSNIQHSIIVINKEIFDQITLMVPSISVSENTSSYEFKTDGYESNTKSYEEELPSSDNTLPGNKNLFMINCPWENWEHSIDEDTPEGYVIWGTKGASSSDIGIYNKLKTGDIIFFSSSTKDLGPFSRKMIFGLGKAKRKFEGTKPYWPEEVEKNKVIWRYRFEFEVLFETYDEKTAIPWIQGLPFTKGFNSIANPDTIAQLLEIVNSKWDQKLSYEKPHRDRFDANGNYVSRTERTEQDADYEFEVDTELTEWENKIKKRLERSEIEHKSGDTRTFDNLYYEGKKLPPYNPDFILKKYKINKRTVILEAHEDLTISAIKQHYVFLEERGDQYYIIVIVKNEDYDKWTSQNEREKFADHVVREADMSQLITKLILHEESSKTKKSTPTSESGQSRKIECLQCGEEFEEPEFFDERGDVIDDGRLNQFCPRCKEK